MGRVLVFSSAFLMAAAWPAVAEDIDDTRLIDLWSSQRSICDDGNEDDPDTWIACGRSEAFAAVLVARGMCLDPGQDVWRVGNHRKAASEGKLWRCSLVTS